MPPPQDDFRVHLPRGAGSYGPSRESRGARRHRESAASNVRTMSSPPLPLAPSGPGLASVTFVPFTRYSIDEPHASRRFRGSLASVPTKPSRSVGRARYAAKYCVTPRSIAIIRDLVSASGGILVTVASYTISSATSPAPIPRSPLSFRGRGGGVGGMSRSIHWVVRRDNRLPGIRTHTASAPAGKGSRLARSACP